MLLSVSLYNLSYGTFVVIILCFYAFVKQNA